MSLLHYNVRSLIPKLDNLKAECTIFKPQVVCICETWLGPDIDDNELSINGYRTIRLDRNRHGGGVALFISSNLSHEVIYLGNGSLNVLLFHFNLALVKYVFACCTDPLIVVVTV